MNKVFSFFLLCFVFGAGWWVGTAVMPPTTSIEYVTVNNTDTTYIDTSEAIIMLDTTIITQVLSDSLLRVIDTREDTILVLKDYMRKLMLESDINLTAVHDSLVKFQGVEFEQKTTYFYGTEQFSFAYKYLSMPVEIRYTKRSQLDYINVMVGVNTHLNGVLNINYKWITVGIETDKSFMVGVNCNFGLVKDLFIKREAE